MTGVSLVLLLTIVSGVPWQAGAPGAGSGGATPLPALTIVSVPVADGQSVSSIVGGLTNLLVDHTTPLTATATSRSYVVWITVSSPTSLLTARVTTNPITGWSNPHQLPGGADALPPLSMWTWGISAHGVNDTSNWTLTAYRGTLTRTAAWQNESFVVFGYTHPSLTVNVSRSISPLNAPTRVGFVLAPVTQNGGTVPIGAGNDTDLTALATGLRPSVVRVSFSAVQTGAYWSPTLNRTVFNFTSFDAISASISKIHSQMYLSVMVGSWGDGNLVPAGMPLNGSYPVVTPQGLVGNFPMPSAYESYISTIVNHTVTARDSVPYWNIGNELPLTSTGEVAEYVQLFNIASTVIHAAWPKALVGSDVMMDKAYIGQFANTTKGVGFLSFHFYPAIGMCVQNGTYCPPAGYPNGSIDSRLWGSWSQFTGQAWYAPRQAQGVWFNLTHKSVPVVNSETNLNAYGGTVAQAANGTDPRLQTLFGAAWIGTQLVEGSLTNLSTFTYYTLSGPAQPPATVSSPYGGWGFGLTSEGVKDRDTQFASYQALRLWSQNVPAYSVGTAIAASTPGLMLAYATLTPSNLTLVLVNQVAVTVSVHLHAGPGLSPRWVTTLDNRSYIEQFNTSTGTMQLLHSGLGHRGINTTGDALVMLQGYGISVVKFAYVPAHGPLRNGGPNTAAPAVGPLGPSAVGSPLPATASPSGPARVEPTDQLSASIGVGPRAARDGHGSA